MATPPRNFQLDHYYHIFNRGVEKRSIFANNADRWRFLETLTYHQQINHGKITSVKDFNIEDRQSPLEFSIVAFCLMPNHFHLVLKQENADGGISRGMANLLNSYTKYYNARDSRVGHLFQGSYKSVEIKTDEQLLHTIRYVLLNPIASRLVKDIKQFKWSSYQELCENNLPEITNREILLGLYGSFERLKLFLEDYIDYAQSLHDIKNLLLEDQN